jgi:hypothetical protein
MSRRELPRFVLLAMQLFIAAVALLFYFEVRPELRELYAGSAMPWSARVALGSWWIPTTVGAGALAAAVGSAVRQRRKRLTWLGAGVAISGLSFAIAAVSAYAPLLR